MRKMLAVAVLLGVFGVCGYSYPMTSVLPSTLFDTITAYDTTNGYADDWQSVYDSTRYNDWYASFSTGSQTFNLTDLSLVLGSGGTPEGTVSINLYSDGDGGPSSYITNIGSITDQAVAYGGTGIYTFTTNTSLNANTRYWIGVGINDGVDSTTAVSTIWGLNYTTTSWDAGVPGESLSSSVFSANNGDWGGAFMMRVSGTVPENNGPVVPEPSTVALAMAGLGLVAWLRRKTVA
jgi:hypothetical protein